jgi:hypothetical protein
MQARCKGWFTGCLKKLHTTSASQLDSLHWLAILGIARTSPNDEAGTISATGEYVFAGRRRREGGSQESNLVWLEGNDIKIGVDGEQLYE